MGVDYDDQDRDQDRDRDQNFVLERGRGSGRPAWLIPALIGAGLLGLLLLLGLAALLRGGGDDDAANQPTATGQVIVNTTRRTTTGPTAGARPSPTATTGAVATTAPATTTTQATGTQRFFVVTGTDGEGVRLRATPGGQQLTVYEEGTRLEQIGPDQTVNGVTWRNVRGPDGQAGFVSAEFTQAEP